MMPLIDPRDFERLLERLYHVQGAIDTLTAATRAAGVPPTTKGSFTCGAAATTTVTQPNVKATSVITLTPTNAAAGTLQAGLTHLYVSAKTAGASFAVTTANAAAAAGTETFDYVVVN